MLHPSTMSDGTGRRRKVDHAHAVRLDDRAGGLDALDDHLGEGRDVTIGRIERDGNDGLAGPTRGQ